jgi:hypothetical protein
MSKPQEPQRKPAQIKPGPNAQPIIIVPLKCKHCGYENKVLFTQEALTAYQAAMDQAKEMMLKEQYTGEKIEVTPAKEVKN